MRIVSMKRYRYRVLVGLIGSGLVILSGMGVVGDGVSGDEPIVADSGANAIQSLADRIGAQWLMRDEGSGCSASDCHSDTKEHSFLHGPMFVDACNTCHTLTDPKTHAFELAREQDDLCLHCHERDLENHDVVHQPYLVGSCLSCHDPHGGSTTSLLNTDHYGDMCLGCHEDLGGARTLSHGPALAGACFACHEPHVSDERKLLARDGRAMCLECHVSLEVEIETALVVHRPVLDDCQICHDPHETGNDSLLIETGSALCVRCHEDIHETIENAQTTHGAILTERACLNCHSPHASDHPRLLKNDIDSLCYECHNKEIEAPDGTLIRNIKGVIDAGKSLHGPVASGNCVSCHEIHGSNNRRLLVRAYSDKMYAPFDEDLYALCFGCHDRSLVMDKKSRTVTQFRNGDTNLHAVHVNNEFKGRTCSVCHDSHAADRENHIHDSVPFGPGGWELPIRFERLGDGGQCASGCHLSLTYSRSTPVDYSDDIEKNNVNTGILEKESKP